jgi:replicative DNA helicase
MIVFTNRGAELAVVGSLIQDTRAHNLLAELTEEDFTDLVLRKAFKVMVKMAAEKKPFDLLAVDTAMGETGTDTLIQAIRNAPTVVLAPYHAEAIRECTKRRKVSEMAKRLFNDMANVSVDVPSALDSLRAQITDLGTSRRSEWVTSADMAKSTFAYLEDLRAGKVHSLDSGIPDLDRVLGGFFPGELTIIGARPGTGKTVFGMVMALHAAKQGKKVGVLNVEMLETQYGVRMVSNLGDVDAMHLRRGALDDGDWEGVVRAVTEMSRLPAAFLFTARYMEDLDAAVRSAGLDLLVVDYIQRVKTREKSESERLRIGHISEMLKDLAVDLRIPVVAMSQLRRPESGATDKMPSMRDLRESGNLEADADGIILLHEPVSDRDPYVRKEDKASLAGWKEKGLRYIAMKIEKQRQGEVGTVNVLFEALKMRYVGIERMPYVQPYYPPKRRGGLYGEDDE